MERPEPVTEEEVEKIVVPALVKWIDESGIRRILEKNGVRDYVFVLVGGSGFGYAVKGTSDTDLMLVYDGFKKKYSWDEYVRMHLKIREYNRGGALPRERNPVKAAIKKAAQHVVPSLKGRVTEEEVDKIVSMLGKEEEIDRVSLEKDLAELLKMARSFDQYENTVLYYDTAAYHEKLPEAFIKAKEKLATAGLHFGQVMVRRSPHLKDIISSSKNNELVLSWAGDTDRLHPGYLNVYLAETLFVLKKGKLVFERENGLAKKMRVFVISLRRTQPMVRYIKDYCNIREFQIWGKKFGHRGGAEGKRAEAIVRQLAKIMMEE